MKVIDNPSEIVLSTNYGYVAVFDAFWNRVDTDDNPIKIREVNDNYHCVTLQEIQDQYESENSVLVVVCETFLNGAVYQLGYCKRKIAVVYSM